MCVVESYLYTLQALRHLYVLAVEPRLVAPCCSQSGSLLSLELEVFESCQVLSLRKFRCATELLLPTQRSHCLWTLRSSSPLFIYSPLSPWLILVTGTPRFFPARMTTGQTCASFCQEAATCGSRGGMEVDGWLKLLDSHPGTLARHSKKSWLV